MRNLCRSIVKRELSLSNHLYLLKVTPFKRLIMIRQLSNFICVMLLCSGLIYSCADETVQPGDETETRLDEDMVDRISEHLHLFNATRIPGDAPSGPSIHSLKISFQDTLYLIDTLPRPVKFLHTNPAENVGGVYIQVFVGGDGGIIKASHHYDV